MAFFLFRTSANGLQSLCCGGGAGLVAIAEWRDARLKAGKPKAEQIRKTGAKVVVTSYDNCRHQITEIGEHYNLGTRVTSLTELTVQALVLPRTKEESDAKETLAVGG